MLTHFKIDNFKSLMDFALPDGEAPLGGFVCLIGLNGSGKSTVLQAIDFVAQLAVGDVSKWLSHRGWGRSELVSKRSKKRNITFSMHFSDKAFGDLSWSGSYNSLQGRCTKEELSFTPPANSGVNDFLPDIPVAFTFEGGVLRDLSGWRRELLTEFSGSVFSKLRVPLLGLDQVEARIIYLLRFFLHGVKSLELLSPHSMRRSSKEAVDVGAGGETLAAFIHGLSASEKIEFFEQLVNFYPQLERAASRSGKYGWKRFFVSERYGSSIELDARHINDGLLRVAAVIAQTIAKTPLLGVSDEVVNPAQKEYQFVLLDEIENGMNPEVVERLVKYLLGVRQQIFVTTHSPLILNYLPDDIARESVFLVYRRDEGSTKVKRFFDINEVSDRLEMMGPGEAFLDVRLEHLSLKLSKVN